MGINFEQGYTDLLPHVGHEIVCTSYGRDRDNAEPDNVAIECIDCSEVLIDFDRPRPAPADVYAKALDEAFEFIRELNLDTPKATDLLDRIDAVLDDPEVRL